VIYLLKKKTVNHRKKNRVEIAPGYILTSVKIALYPTEEQEKAMHRQSDVFRKAYNWGLGIQKDRRDHNLSLLTAYNLRDKWKQEIKRDPNLSWTVGASINGTAVAFNDLSLAYANYNEKQEERPGITQKKLDHFKRIGKTPTEYDNYGHPKFKNRNHTEPTFAIHSSSIYFMDKTVSIQCVGDVLYRTNIDIPKIESKSTERPKLYNPRVHYTGGKWILTVSFEIPIEIKEFEWDYLGGDFGIVTFLTLSVAGKCIEFENINKTVKLKREEYRLHHLQRIMSRRDKLDADGNHSNNWYKAKEQVNRAYRRLANQRRDYVHKTTHFITELSVAILCFEALQTSNMMKLHNMAKPIQDASWREARRQLEYKSARKGQKLILADTFFPSSKRCSCCGNKKVDLKRGDRIYKCDKCGAVLGRDYNAAENLIQYARAELAGYPLAY